MTKLAQIAQINPKLEARLADEDSVSFLGMADVSELGDTTAGETRSYRHVAKGYTPFRRGDVLVAKITPCFQNGKIAQAETEHELAFGSTEFHVVRPDSAVADARYVLHFLRTSDVREAGERRMTGSGGQRRVPRGYLDDVDVPLPPLQEQRRIAAILDQADELRAKRRRTLALLDESIASTVDAMLASTAVGPAMPLASLAHIITGPFGSSVHREDYRPGGVPLVNPKHIVGGLILPDETVAVGPAKAAELDAFRLETGDIVLGRRGEMGRAAEVLATSGPLICGTGSMIIRPRAGVSSALLTAFLRSPGTRQKLEERAQGVTMLNLNQQIVGSLRVALPSGQEQRASEITRTALFAARQKMEYHLAHLDELFASLQHRAFNGQL